MHYSSHPRTICDFLQLAGAERSPHGSRSIMPDHDAPAEERRQNSYCGPCDRVTMQIINENSPSARSPHLPENQGALRIRQVVKGERADHRIERRVGKRKQHTVAHHRLSGASPAQSESVDIERDHPIGSRLRKDIPDIATPCRNIENRQTLSWRQKPFNGPNASEPAVDQSQLSIRFIELGRRSRQVVHQLGYWSPSRKVRHHAVCPARARSSSIRSRYSWPVHSGLLRHAPSRGHSRDRTPGPAHRDSGWPESSTPAWRTGRR